MTQVYPLETLNLESTQLVKLWAVRVAPNTVHCFFALLFPPNFSVEIEQITLYGVQLSPLFTLGLLRESFDLEFEGVLYP